MPEAIIVVEYDPEWPKVFEELRDQVAVVLGDLTVAIQHIGSTAVPGLAAKPIIDMDVVVPSTADIPIAIEQLATLGYIHEGDGGIPGREAFTWPPDRRRHHLYVCARDSEVYQRHLLFRDYLRAHPEEARAYAALKRSSARRFQNDRNAYTIAKTAFVEERLRRAAKGV
jgi:GrpB-like predicted nucleotidyltransferase (UPF0157 family)